MTKRDKTGAAGFFVDGSEEGLDRVVPIRLSQATRDNLRVLAVIECRTLSAMARILIEQGLLRRRDVIGAVNAAIVGGRLPASPTDNMDVPR